MFSQHCLGAGLNPILGADLVVQEPEGHGPVTLIAETGEGYANLCRLVYLAHATGGRSDPTLDGRFLETHAGGLIVLLGAPGGVLADLMRGVKQAESQALVKRYRDWFGAIPRFSWNCNSTWFTATPRATSECVNLRNAAASAR